MSGLYGSVLGRNYKTIMLACFRHRVTGHPIKSREVFRLRHEYYTLNMCLTCGYHNWAETNTIYLDDARTNLSQKFNHFSSLQKCKQKFCTSCSQTHLSSILSHGHRLNNHKSEILAPILRLHFSQLHGQEGLKPGDIPMAAKVKPLSAKEIKPLLNPEEKSKVEETCETLKAKQQAETSKTLVEVLDEALQPKKTESEPVKKSLAQSIVHEVKHYANGFRLLFINIRISMKQLWKVLNGHDLSRRERKLFLRTVSDLFRLVPFMVFLIIPFMEFLIPVALKIFPNMLPSTFEDKTQTDKVKRKQLKVKLSMAKFLQDTVEEMALSADNQENQEETKAFFDFIEKIRSRGEQPSNQDIIKFSRLFEDEITLGNMTYDQLKAINRMLTLPTIGSKTYLRFQLNMKLRQLRADDVLIKKEGIDSLTVSELQSACRARGMRALGVPEARLKSQLSQWLELHLDEHVPASLLLMSRALYNPEKLSSPVDQLKTALSTLPEDAVEEAEILAAELAGEEADPQTKIDILKKEELLCEEERVEEEIMKEEDMKLKETLDTTELMEAREILFSQMELLKQPSPFLRRNDDQISKEEWKTLDQSWKDTHDADKEDLHKIREDRDEYQEELRELKALDVKNTMKESAASVRIGKRVDKLIEELSQELDDIEESTLVLDQDKDGVITTAEFLNYMKGRDGCPKATKMEKVFKILDEDHDGKISVADLNKVLALIAEQDVDLNEQQISDIIRVVTIEKQAEEEIS